MRLPVTVARQVMVSSGQVIFAKRDCSSLTLPIPARPVEVLAEVAHAEHPLREHAGVARRLRELLVDVHRVRVAGGARVLRDLRPGDGAALVRGERVALVRLVVAEHGRFSPVACVSAG